MATIFARQALLSVGWANDVRLTIADGIIVAVETGVEPGPADDIHAAIIPGMPNLHSHAFQRAFAGRTERRGAGEDSFWTWREAMYAAALRMSPEDVEAVAGQLYVEMLEAGFTRVGEFHYLHHAPDGTTYANIGEMAERIAAAAAETGIGLTLLPVFYAHGGFGGVAPGEGQRRFISDIGTFGHLVERSERAVTGLESAIIGIAPHSLRAVTEEELREILPLARGGPIHIHVAEQVKEVDDCFAAHEMRPVERLFAIAPVDSRWCLIHATHMYRHEAIKLAESGAVAGLCPITEANLGDGLFKARDVLDAGGRIGIGSDSNIEISLGGELRLFEYGQRLDFCARNVLGVAGMSTGGRLFRQVQRGGHQALGVGASELRRGEAADFITLQPGYPEWDMPVHDALLDALIFAPRNVALDCVYVRGKRLVEGGRHHAREAVARRFGQAMRRIWA